MHVSQEASEILEWVESPETAISGCLSFLKDLHRLLAVLEIFSVYLNCGVKSMLNEAERVENVKNDVVNISWIVSIIFEYSLVGP